jgi:hypothetical protein
MVMLVHVTAAKFEPKIKRSGLRADFGIYAFPVLPSYTLTHQWTREMLKWKRGPMIGVYFRVPDNELVRFGRYGAVMRTRPAVQAVGEIHKEADPRGFQIVVERAIKPNEITRVTPLRGVLGWRHMPDAHGNKPCACAICQRGEPNSRRIMKRTQLKDDNPKKLPGWFTD